MKMEQQFEKIKELVFKEKFTIKPVYLVSIFDLDIKQAQFLLESFSEKNQNLVVKYGLIGYQGDLNDEIRGRRFIEVEKDEVEIQKKSFTKLTSCTIRSIKDKSNVLDIFPEDLTIIKSKEDLINYQRKGFCLNENVHLREDKLENLLERLGLSKEDLTKPSKTLINVLSKQIKNKVVNVVETEDKPKVKDEIKVLKVTNKPKDILSSLKKLQSKASLAKNETVVEKVKTSSPKTDKKTEKEEIKLKNDKSEEKRTFSKIKRAFDDESSEDDRVYNEIDDIEMDEDEIYVKSKKGNQIKRSKTLDSDSDDDLTNAKENIKHKNKKQRKRVIDFDDSSEEEEKFIDKFIETNKSSQKKPLEQESSKLVEEEETFIDEEGYKQHRIIKKIIKEDDKSETGIQKSSKQDDNKAPANEIKFNAKKLETSPFLKTEAKKTPFDHKPKPSFENNKSKSSFDNKFKPSFDNKSKQSFGNKSKLAAKQPSIMNFFKPKTQSK